MRALVHSKPERFVISTSRGKFRHRTRLPRRIAQNALTSFDVSRYESGINLPVKNNFPVAVIGKKHHSEILNETNSGTSVPEKDVLNTDSLNVAISVIKVLSGISQKTKSTVIDAINDMRNTAVFNSASSVVLPRLENRPNNDTKWPTETYSEAYHRRGVNIIQFLEDPNGWLPLIEAGLVSRPVLRARDISAERALANFLRGGHRTLPKHLKIPTKSETIDYELSSGVVPVQDAARLYHAWRSRQPR